MKLTDAGSFKLLNLLMVIALAVTTFFRGAARNVKAGEQALFTSKSIKFSR